MQSVSLLLTLYKRGLLVVFFLYRTKKYNKHHSEDWSYLFTEIKRFFFNSVFAFTLKDQGSKEQSFTICTVYYIFKSSLFPFESSELIYSPFLSPHCGLFSVSNHVCFLCHLLKKFLRLMFSLSLLLFCPCSSSF